MKYIVGDHYKIRYKVGSQFAWIDCTICEPSSMEVVQGTWPIIPSHNRIYPELDGERTDILTLLSCMSTHTEWHEGRNERLKGNE